MNVINVVPMMSAPPPSEPRHPHASVLLDETIAALAPRAGGVYVDATLGAGGHTEALLSLPGTHVVGLDRDDVALDLARARLARFGARFTAVRAPFPTSRAWCASSGTRRSTAYSRTSA